jgi:TPP-dependent indolepyruvate ferredoxin oxidoreductase alpha subunit
MLMLGNEAIAGEGIEAGVAFARDCPGTPSSEIAQQFVQISRVSDLYFAYLEEAVRNAAQKVGLRLPVVGKGDGLFSRLYELDPAWVKRVIAACYQLPHKPSCPLHDRALSSTKRRKPFQVMPERCRNHRHCLT